MSPAKESVEYLIFDVETVADGDLISRVKYSADNLSAADAMARYRAELIEQTGKDVMPPTFTLPIAVAVAKINRQYELLDLTSLDAPDYRPHEITRRAQRRLRDVFRRINLCHG